MRAPLTFLLATGLFLATMPAQAATGDARAMRVVDRFLAAYEKVQTFQGRVHSETRKDGHSQSVRSDLWLAKPHFTALRMVEAPEMRAAEGTKIVWYGEPSVHVLTRFFGFPVRVHPRYDDPRLLGLRGWTMRDLSIVSVVAMFKDPRTKVSWVGTQTWLGRPMQVLETRSPRGLATTDRQQHWIDDALSLPFVTEAYDGNERAFRIQIESFAFDKKLPSDTFTID